MKTIAETQFESLCDIISRMEQKDVKQTKSPDAETARLIPGYFEKAKAKLNAKDSFKKEVDPSYFWSEEDREPKRVEFMDGNVTVTVYKKYDEAGKSLRITLFAKHGESKPWFKEILIENPKSHTIGSQIVYNSSQELNYKVNTPAAWEKADNFLSDL